MNEEKQRPWRLIALAVVFLTVFTVFTVQLVNIQLVNGEEYLSEAEQISGRTVDIPAARGEIIDRFGRPLTVNRTGWSVVFDRAFLPDDKLNYTIYKLTELFTRQGEEWIDDLPLSKTAPYTFTGNEFYIDRMRERLELAGYATAENCYDAMIERYDLQQYDQATARIIMGVRYEMEDIGYSLSTNYVFADDISQETMAIVEEHRYMLSGVNIREETYRQYVSGTIATSLLGYVSPIYKEDYEELADKGYAMNDTVGRGGIEQALESELRGKGGERVIVQNAEGIVTSSVTTVEAQSGHTVKLTLDKHLQETAQKSLQNTIMGLNEANEIGDGGDASAGAAVVFDVNNFEILAAATYPSYDMDTFLSDYESLADGENQPMFDRAVLGAYRPGSSFKPAIASIGLQLGLIQPDETIRCNHVYTYFSDVGFSPTCLSSHGSLNVTEALTVSCNIFFYETGRRIGIDRMNEYCAMLGLGQPTGIEIYEGSGVLDGMTYREENGLSWYVGDVVQCAIGQGENAFTPLQLAAYVSTIANGGTRYNAHLVKSINSYNNDTVIKETELRVMDEMNFSESTLNAVKQGMRRVVTQGTAAYVLSDYPVPIAGKTGTAEVSEDKNVSDNVVFVSFAPYDEPQIAVVTVIEHGAYSSAVCRVAKDIYDAYFYYKGEQDSVTGNGTLLP